MNTSSSRFKSIAVTTGLSFWFFIFISTLTSIQIEITLLFFVMVLVITQIFREKVSKGLDIFAIINTKIFLGILFGTVFSVYGIIFKLLQIDLLRLKKQSDSYWLDVQQTEDHRIRKQY